MEGCCLVGTEFQFCMNESYRNTLCDGCAVLLVPFLCTLAMNLKIAKTLPQKVKIMEIGVKTTTFVTYFTTVKKIVKVKRALIFA